jgi:hypothetical protein
MRASLFPGQLLPGGEPGRLTTKDGICNDYEEHTYTLHPTIAPAFPKECRGRAQRIAGRQYLSWNRCYVLWPRFDDTRSA